MSGELISEKEIQDKIEASKAPDVEVEKNKDQEILQKIENYNIQLEKITDENRYSSESEKILMDAEKFYGDCITHKNKYFELNEITKRKFDDLIYKLNVIFSDFEIFDQINNKKWLSKNKLKVEKYQKWLEKISENKEDELYPSKYYLNCLKRILINLEEDNNTATIETKSELNQEQATEYFKKVSQILDEMIQKEEDAGYRIIYQSIKKEIDKCFDSAKKGQFINPELTDTEYQILSLISSSIGIEKAERGFANA